MAKAITVTKLGVVGGTVYNVGNYVLEATIADAVVAAGLATVTQADVPDDIDLSTPEAILNAMGDTPSLIIVSASVTTKPSSPNEKDVYIVPAGSAWAALDEAYDNQLALFERGGWKYITPKFGWQVRNKADNGVLWYDGDSWEVVSTGGGSGTVTSVGLSLPNIFTISGSPVTTSGTLTATLANQSANQIFAGPSSGGAATPGFRSLVAADIPDISGVYATKAYADGLVVGLLDDRGNFDASSNTFPAAGGSGSGGAVLKGDLWTISVAGTLGGTAVTPGDIVRALTDAPGQTASNWAVSETNIGYTALNASLNSGQIYVGNGSNVGTARTLSGDVTVNNTGVTAIGNAKVTNAMLAGSIDLTAKVTGVLPVANGGTGLSALGSALQVLRVNAGATALEYAAASGGSPGGSDTQLQRNNAGAFGGISGATSDGTNVTFGSGNLRATLPQFTTGLRDANGNLMLGFSPTASATESITITNNTATNAVGLTATTSTAAASTQAGNGLNVTAAPAIAGTTNAGAAAGGSVRITAGNAARLTSGNANGGSVILVDGTGIGTGVRGGFNFGGTSSSDVKLTIFSNGYSAPSLSLQNGAGSDGLGSFHSGTASYGVAGSGGLLEGVFVGASGGRWTLAGGVYGFASTSASGIATLDGNRDVGITRKAANVLRITGASDSGAGSLVIGSSSVGSIGSSGVAVLAIGNGTAPGSSPADTGQIYAADWNGAGTSAIHIRNEEGHIVKICSQAVAALTNNVSSGGTNDQIDNWTDLATYATDAAAIRNAIYQLSRKLAEVVTAQRSNGLFR